MIIKYNSKFQTSYNIWINVSLKKKLRVCLLVESLCVLACVQFMNKVICAF